MIEFLRSSGGVSEACIDFGDLSLKVGGICIREDRSRCVLRWYLHRFYQTGLAFRKILAERFPSGDHLESFAHLPKGVHTEGLVHFRGNGLVFGQSGLHARDVFGNDADFLFQTPTCCLIGDCRCETGPQTVALCDEVVGVELAAEPLCQGLDFFCIGDSIALHQAHAIAHFIVLGQRGVENRRILKNSADRRGRGSWIGLRQPGIRQCGRPVLAPSPVVLARPPSIGFPAF